MVRASLDDGQQLLALNEIFVGHPSHQTARYDLRTPDDAWDSLGPSGVIVATGTGATGRWRSSAGAGSPCRCRASRGSCGSSARRGRLRPPAPP
jgi:NAD kinase